MMTGRRTRFTKYGHVTSFDEVFFDDGIKYLGQNRKNMSFESKCITFTLQNSVTGLMEALAAFKEKNVNVSHIESRKSRDGAKVEIYVECELKGNINDVIALLKEKVGICDLRHRSPSVVEDVPLDDVPWFPRCLRDLDRCSKNVLMYGSELDADHPGFKDELYRKRRSYFTDLAMEYKHGEPIPRIDYTEEEINTWGKVYGELMKLYPTYACSKHITNLHFLSLHCGFSPDAIPQLEDVSLFLQERTGFRLRPVAGFLSPRDFLAGLAFRVFNCTQYIRHGSDPLYTPEPDVCHELMGHVPMLADPGFASFSQEIGLASLGASEDDISKLAACYLFTVEFGLCKELGTIKAYGAGLLSCASELKHALTSPDKMQTFDPEVASRQEFYVTTFQPTYFVSETLEQAKEKMREFIRLIKRPFAVRYNAITSSVEVLNSAHSLQSAVSQLQAELAIIGDALKKLTSQEIVYDETKKPNGYKGANDTTPRSRSSSYCDVIKE